MRRFSLGLVVLVVTMLAVPATGRTFRTDLFKCGGTFSGLVTLHLNEPTVPYCWDDVPPELSNGVQLPTDNGTSFETGGGEGGTPIMGGNAALTFVHRQPFLPFNFIIQAFDYPQFLRDIGNPSGLGLTPPRIEVTHGLGRSDSPSDDNFFNNSLLRINWFLDPTIPSKYPAFANIFFDAVVADQTYFGVQLIFYGDGFPFAPLDPPLEGVGFELNGLRDFSYSRSTLWDGSEEPCGVFNNDGRPLCSFQEPPSSIPEPSSFALLGLGFLALVFGRRRGKSARVRST